MRKFVFIIAFILVFGGLVTACSRQEPPVEEKIELTEEELDKRLEEFDAVNRKLSIERRNRIRQERMADENTQKKNPDKVWTIK